MNAFLIILNKNYRVLIGKVYNTVTRQWFNKIL